MLKFSISIEQIFVYVTYKMTEM